MKKIFAVVATIVALCTALVLSSCGENTIAGSDYDADTNSKGLITPVKEKSCKIAGIKSPQAWGAITRAAAVEEDYNKPDGLFEVTVMHEQEFTGCIPEDALKKYEGKARFRSYGVVNKPRYVRDIANLRDGKPTLSIDELPDGRVRHLVVNKDGNDHSLDYSLVEEQEYDSDTTYVEDLVGNKKGFVRCKDAWENLKFQNREVTDLGSDSAKWHKYQVVDFYKPTLLSHFDVGIFKVKYFVWEWRGKGDPDFPDDEWEVIRYFTKNEWITPTDSITANTGFEVYASLSNGTEKFYKKKDVDLLRSVTPPAYQSKQVEDFEWNSLDAFWYSEVTDGNAFEKKDSIYVQPLLRVYATKTNKGLCEFTHKRQGRAYWIDPLGEHHYFKDAEWSASDNGWTKSDLSDTDVYNRILLTSRIISTYLEMPKSTKGEIELKKLKDGKNKPVNAEYTEKGIRMITPIGRYYTYGTKWLIFANGSKEKVGEVGTYIGASVVSPEAQTIDVTDWSITDGQAQWYGEARQKVRTDTVSNGVFHITPWNKNYVTKTNKSSHKFVVTWDKTVIYTDEFGNDVEFIGLNPVPSDKGGVKTMVDLSDEDDYNRKQMTTTMNLVVREDNADYSGTVIFRKPIEKEELVEGPTVTPSWKWFDNGKGGTGSLKITYRLKLAGPQEINVSQDEEWSITNEAKSHVILSSATADHQNIDNSINWGTTTSSNPQTGVTLYTTTGTIKDHFTTLTDGYSTKKQTAKYTFTILDKEYTYDFPAPSDMMVTHTSASLTNGDRTATENGKLYNVWDHSGTVTATVTTTSDGSKTQTATDEKEIWVSKASNPDFPFDATWHVAKANRFYTGSQWCDGFLYSNENDYFIVVYFFNLNKKASSETLVDTKTYTYPKSDFVVPTEAARAYNAVMWDIATGKAIPCHLEVDGDGWSLSSQYADGRSVTKRHKRQEDVMSGVKNLAEEDKSTPSPWIATSWSEETINGHIYYHATWHTTTHSMNHTVGYKAN